MVFLIVFGFLKGRFGLGVKWVIIIIGMKRMVRSM